MADEQPLRERLQEDLLDSTPWEALRLHVEKGTVLLVHQLDLIDVAEAFALDDAATVGSWLESEQIQRPTPAQQASFQEEQRTFRAVIVQPWVLIQAIVH